MNTYQVCNHVHVKSISRTFCRTEIDNIDHNVMDPGNRSVADKIFGGIK